MDELMLLSGIDIPFFPAKVNIHQPTIREIGYIGEEGFFLGVQLLTFSKAVLSEEDKTNLEEVADFEILMSIVNSQETTKEKLHLSMLLTLLFPEYQIDIRDTSIVLTHFDTQEIAIIDSENFEELRLIILKMFISQKTKQDEFKPKNEAAKKIAEKLQKGREKLAELKGDKSDKINILSRYVSILAIGLKMDMNVLLSYTVYQLYDVFERFQLYQNFDIVLKAKLAGASDVEDADNWMDDIHN